MSDRAGNRVTVPSSQPPYRSLGCAIAYSWFSPSTRKFKGLGLMRTERSKLWLRLMEVLNVRKQKIQRCAS